MQFEVDGEDLSISLRLAETDPPVDLTVSGLGDRILDLAVEEMIRAHARRESPAGAPWAPLRPSTVRQKGRAAIGVRSGGMLDPGRWRTAPRDLEPRRATWIDPYGDLRRGRAYGQAYGFHTGNARTGQPARPLIGGTVRAQEQARALVQMQGGGLS